MSKSKMTTSSIHVDSDITPLCPDWPEQFCQFYQQLGCWTDETFAGFLADLAAQQPNRYALIDNEQTYTYQQLHHHSEIYAKALYQLGIRAGHRVVIQLPNCAALVIASFALFRLGALPIFALPAHRWREISHFCRFASARALITVDKFEQFDFAELASQLQQALPTLATIIIVGESEHFLTWRQLLEIPSSVTLPPLPKARDLALMQLSGGTTGLNKLIPRRHADYLYSLRMSNQICAIDQSSIYLTALPMAHNFPMSSPGFLGVLYAGGCVILTDNPRPDVCFPLIQQHQVTITSLVPPLLLVWLQASKRLHNSLSSLKILQVGGAKLLPEIAQRVYQCFSAQLQQVFGMAEGLVNYTRLDDPQREIIETQGRPMSPYDEIKIVDQYNQLLSAGETGFLLTRGPYTIRGYFNATETNAELFDHEGFYHTGDLAFINKAGNLVVSGRVKDQINRGGEKFAMDEVEAVLLAHPQVFDAAVVGMPDAILGERACAFIVCQNEQKPNQAELVTFLQSQLAAYKIPDRFEWLDKFPVSAVGKISRQQLRAILLQQLTTPTIF